jgi:crotonobetainyl-CoA:carnitine CoA-transferase CaiB-like acyl-CoA transferase
MAESKGERSVLAGVRILDLTDETGDFCTKLLAALGADVLRLEPPRGDASRRLGPFGGGDPRPEKSLHWLLHNAGKRSITLNIENPDGRGLFLRLLEGADSLVECKPPGYLKGLGLDYPNLRHRNQRLIHTTITPFGSEGPFANYRADDFIINAMGGMMYQCGAPDTPPVNISSPVAYISASAQAAVGTMLAFYHRELTGRGQHVDVSMQEATLWAEKPFDVAWKAEGKIVARGGDAPRNALDPIPMFRLYFACQDGFVAAMPTYWSHRDIVRRWLRDEGLAERLYRPEWEEYFTGAAAVAPEGLEDELFARFGDLMSRHPKAYLYLEGQRRGMQICPINHAGETLADHQLAARRYFVEMDFPGLGGTYKIQGAPFPLPESPWRITRPAPRIGEHNQEIYCGELGLDPKELAVLRATGAI